MRFKSLLVCFALIAIGLGFTNCNKEEEDVIIKTDPPVEYTITHPAESEMYTFECVEVSKEKKEVIATLTVLKEYQNFLPALTIKTSEDKLVEYDENMEETEAGTVYTYTFTMPSADVVIAVELSEDKTEYTIGLPAENDMFTFECINKARKNVTVTATLTIKEGYEDYLPALTIKTEAGKVVEYTEDKVESETENAYTYTFIMPAINITIAAELRENDTEYTIGKLSKNDDFYLFECVDKAKENETIVAQLTMLPGNEKYTPIFTLTTQSGKNVEYTESNASTEMGLVYSYEFKMPGENVTPSVEFTVERRTVSVDAENVYLWVMNAYDKNNPDVMSSEPGLHVGFHFNTQLGYEFTEEVPEVTGDESGDIQFTFWNEEGMLNGYQYLFSCWTFTMPLEPVTIKVHASEKTTYVDKAFAGKYKGYQIGGGISNFYSGGSTLELDLNANTSYTVTSTDENKFDFKGEYVMNEEENAFTYVADRVYDPSIDNTDISMYSHAIRGHVLSNGDLFFTAENMVVNSSENYRYYYASQEDCSFVCASTEYNSYSLLEVVKGGETKHYFFDSYNGTLKDAEVRFISGSSIGSDCEAVISIDGVAIYKYTYTNGSPKFIDDDGMKGTYTGSEGDLVLDGFGGAILGGQTGTYVLKNNNTLIVVTIGTNETTYVINASAKTYSAFDPNAWSGPVKFFAQTSGTVGGSPSKARITVFIGTDLQGKKTPGLGGIVAEVENGTNSYYSIISATSAYEYNAAEQTITFTNMLTKTDPSQSGIRNPVTFKVSNELQTLTSIHETLYKYNSTSNSINLKDVEIHAEVAPTE